MGRSIESVENAKTKILGLTMVPTVGTVYRFVYIFLLSFTVFMHIRVIIQCEW